MKLAVVCSHPIQYYAPWLAYIAARLPLKLRVFYLWRFGTSETFDPGFERNVVWDIPLLEGYESEFVENLATRPGTSHFSGLDNPELPERLRAYAPDAILLIGYRYLSHFRVLFSRTFRNTPLLLRGDSHRLVASGGFGTRLRDALRNLVFRRFAGFLYVGAANKTYYELSGVPARKLFFAPHAVDNERFARARLSAEAARSELRRQLGLSDGDVVVLFSGKFERKKRPDLLLTAFMKVRNPRARLVLQGAGAMEGELRRQAEGDPRIRWLPFRNQSEMPEVYSLADVLALPSEGADESWGLCVNEAMCMGRPVIVSDHVGCAQDLVKPGQNGLVVRAGDERSLVEALEDALGDPERLRRWGVRSTEIIAHYSYAQATDGLASALDAVSALRWR